MESLIVIVGFLGAGKTTLLKQLAEQYLNEQWSPFIILNDYENAYLDAGQLPEAISPDWIKPLNGSCICCSGITELRDSVNRIPERNQGVTLIEANGTSDACSLMGFLGVGIDERFRPPVQISVVDVKNWQKREPGPQDSAKDLSNNNEIEANQIQVSSLIVLNHLESVSEDRRSIVKEELRKLNPHAMLLTRNELTPTLLSSLKPSKNRSTELDHKKTHWASCSIDLPVLRDESCINAICDSLPRSILRVKGCTKVGDSEHYTFFERSPDGVVNIRPFRGVPITGSKLLTVGPGSDPELLKKVVSEFLEL